MRPTHRYPLITLALTAALTLAGALFVPFLSWLVAYLIAINVVTFLTYFHDKRAARWNNPRVPESTLHLLALLGGSPAALAAQQAFHHKTLKRSFRLLYWAIVALQVAAVVWWFAR